jgi:hypothetical protein
MTRVMKRQLEDELDLDNNPLSIRPPVARPTPHDDDTYSPAHEPLPTGATRVEPEVRDEPVPDSNSTEDKKET